jgi:hypothetical protein
LPRESCTAVTGSCVVAKRSCCAGHVAIERQAGVP